MGMRAEELLLCSGTMHFSIAPSSPERNPAVVSIATDVRSDASLARAVAALCSCGTARTYTQAAGPGLAAHPLLGAPWVWG